MIIPSRFPSYSSFILAAVFVFAPLHAWADLRSGMDAGAVLGQPDFTSSTANNGGTSARSLSTPKAVVTDGTRLFVTDRANHRVLIWNTIPETNFVAADIVLGQPNFVSSAANNGGTTNASALNTPHSVCVAGNRVFVVDPGSNRVLIWNSIPTLNFQPADVVVGQPNFTSSAFNSGGRSARSLSLATGTETGVFSDGKRLFVADSGNHRVLIWDSIPTTNFAAADVVLGQPDFTSATADNGGVSAKSLRFPQFVASDGTRLFVTDGSARNRLLIFNQIPSSNFASADVVVGQATFGQFGANPVSAGALNPPRQSFSDGQRLFAANSTYNRVLIWDAIPTTNAEPADFVLGQPDFSSNQANNGGVSARSMSDPNYPFFDGRRLFVTDAGNNRVLVFNLAADSATRKLGPQFEQGKAVLGKVWADEDADGWQDPDEPGLDGVRVVSDTGISAVTDSDGKFHFPYIEVGQRLLKVDPSSLPEGAELTTDSPRKVIVTEGILTKVSFGVKLPPGETAPPAGNAADPLLKVSVAQDPVRLQPQLEVTAERTEKGILFKLDCNYALFLDWAEMVFYDKEMRNVGVKKLDQPLPGKLELAEEELPAGAAGYQLSVYDSKGHQDRTSIAKLP